MGLEYKHFNIEVKLPACSHPFKVRKFAAATSANTHYDIKKKPVSGYVVLCEINGETGFWGPVSHDVAVLALHFANTTPWTTPIPVHHTVSHIHNYHRHSHTGLALVAATALEYAAWDLIAKQRQVPVWQLLFDLPPPSCKIYATFFGLETSYTTLSTIIDTYGLKEQVKKIGIDNAASLDQLITNSETKPSTWAVDFKAKFNIQEACNKLSRLPDDLAWIEEPLPPQDMDLLSLFNNQHPIAAGEHFYTAFEFLSARQQGVSIFQPDPTFSGGLNNYLRIASMLSHYGTFFPHGNGLIPALHLAGATPTVPELEFHFGIEAKRQVLWQHKIIPDNNASIHAPSLPGWLGSMCETVKILD